MPGAAQAVYDWYNVPATARQAAQGIYEGTGLKEHLDELDQIK